MKICMITAWGFQHLDGSNLRTFFLLNELLKRNHTITLVHASRADAKYSQKRFGCTALCCGIDINRWDSHQKKIIKYIQFVRKARQIVKNTESDLIFGISLINAMAAICRPALPPVLMYVDFMSNYYQYAHPNGLMHRTLFHIGRYLERYTMHKAQKIIVITQSLKNLVPQPCRSRTHVIPDGADTKHLVFRDVSDTAKKNYGIAANEFVIGYQGGIEAHDGLQFLAHIAGKIVSHIPHVRFLIAGRGGYLEKIKQIVSGNGSMDRFIFTGWIKSEEIPSIMAATNLNVVPIPDHPATAPLITFRLLESMAAGVNVIVNDLPGMRDR